MSTQVDNTTILTFQGDTCEITFTDLEVGHLIGFEVRDRKTNNPIFDEMQETVDANGEVTFVITPELSNLFNVNPAEGVNAYYYGIKAIDEVTGEENTILLGETPRYSDRYLIKVYLKKVEGNIENG